MYINMVLSKTLNAKSRARQFQVCYLRTTHSSALKAIFHKVARDGICGLGFQKILFSKNRNALKSHELVNDVFENWNTLKPHDFDQIYFKKLCIINF